MKLKELLTKESVPGQPGFKLPYKPYNDKGKTRFDIKITATIQNDSEFTGDEIVKLLKTGDATIGKGMNNVFIERVSDGKIMAIIEMVSVT